MTILMTGIHLSGWYSSILPTNSAITTLQNTFVGVWVTPKADGAAFHASGSGVPAENISADVTINLLETMVPVLYTSWVDPCWSSLCCLNVAIHGNFVSLDDGIIPQIFSLFFRSVSDSKRPLKIKD